MKIIEFSDSHLGKEQSNKSNMGRLLDMVAREKPDLLIGNGDIVDLWRAKEEEIEKNPLVRRLKELSGKMETVFIVGNHDFNHEALGRFFPNANKIALSFCVEGFWFEHGHLKDFVWQGIGILRPIFDAHPEWAHWIFNHLYQPWRDKLRRNPGEQKLKVRELRVKNAERAKKKDFAYRQYARTIWYRALSFADWKQGKVTEGIVIGHDHSAGSWTQGCKPYLWNGGSVRDDGTYLEIIDRVPEVKRV